MKTKFIGFEKHLNNEFAFLAWFMIELFKILFNFEYLIFYSFIKSLSKNKNSIKRLFEFIGTIDVAISVASVLHQIKTCQPKFVSEKQYDVQNIYHPLIDNCVANSINLDHKSLLLTGSNMSGKTTFIRTLAINSLMAETLGFVFGESYKVPFLRIFSAIKITDNLSEHKSYFLSEVLTIKQMIDVSKSQDFNLFVLDELLKGTNTAERISGGKAILSYLNDANSLVLVSTHDIELTDLLKHDDYDLYHFSELVSKETLTFDYQLQNGKLKTRNALKILALYDYPDKLNKDAQQILNKITITYKF